MAVEISDIDIATSVRVKIIAAEVDRQNQASSTRRLAPEAIVENFPRRRNRRISVGTEQERSSSCIK